MLLMVTGIVERLLEGEGKKEGRRKGEKEGENRGGVLSSIAASIQLQLSWLLLHGWGQPPTPASKPTGLHILTGLSRLFHHSLNPSGLPHWNKPWASAKTSTYTLGKHHTLHYTLFFKSLYSINRNLRRPTARTDPYPSHLGGDSFPAECPLHFPVNQE